jgi:nitrate reductase molybdenum cofactor assembly chaperone NarJ/NarW
MNMIPKLSDAAISLRVLARLLSYPDAGVRSDLSAMRDALHAGTTIAPSRLAEIDALIASLAQGDPIEVEAAYVQLFDRGRATSLHLFEHVHGDSRNRGPAMIDLAQTYEQAGLHLAPGELPDYLPVVLEFASTQPPREARAFLAEMAHILNAVYSALRERRSAYAALLAALLEFAGENPHEASVPPEAPLDESWSEPAAFDGCATAGQARPGEPQPLHFVRNDASRKGAAA